MDLGRVDSSRKVIAFICKDGCGNASIISSGAPFLLKSNKRNLGQLRTSFFKTWTTKANQKLQVQIDFLERTEDLKERERGWNSSSSAWLVLHFQNHKKLLSRKSLTQNICHCQASMVEQFYWWVVLMTIGDLIELMTELRKYVSHSGKASVSFPHFLECHFLP